MPREMFGTCSHTGRLQASDPGCAVPRHPFGVATKTADADNGVVGPGVEVNAGSEVHGAARPAQRPADRGRGVASRIQVVEPTQYSVAREWSTRIRKEPRDIAAF